MKYIKLFESFDKKDLSLRHKQELFLNDILVAESYLNIEQPDKWFDDKYVTIHDLKTLEKFRGNGFATELVDKIFDYVKNELKLNIISLIVYKDNYKAVNLYFKCGFEIFEEYNDSYCLIKKLDV